MAEGRKGNADARSDLSRGKEDRGRKAGKPRVGLLQIPGEAVRPDRFKFRQENAQRLYRPSVYCTKDVPEKSFSTVSAGRKARMAFPRAEQ